MFFSPTKGELNGFFHFLDTHSYLRNEVDLFVSSRYNETRDPWLIFDYEDQTRWAQNSKDLYPWLQISLKHSYFHLNQYTIRSTDAGYAFRGWKLEVSNNNETESKIILDNVEDTKELYDWNCSKRSVNSHHLYNTFRFIQTERPEIDNIMRISAIEFFGTY